MKYKIGIVGSAGTGKSGLATLIANYLNIPCCNAKNITRDILSRYEYKWESGIQVEKFLAKKECQEEMYSATVLKEDRYESFVTDRTVIDLAAYTISELNDEIEYIDRMLTLYKQHATSYTHIFLCPWGLVPLENNKIRTLNPFYQFKIHSLICGVLNEWGIKYYIVCGKGNDRLENIKKFL